jgi:DeoR/GlpR family transcriptional regulator of sugar metabolism
VGVTYVFARRAYRNDGEHEAIVAAAEIKGVASVITRTESAVQELLRRMEHPWEPTVEGIGQSSMTQTMLEVFAFNEALFERFAANSAQKRAIGKYVRRMVRPGDSFAVDCGTTTAWAFFECLKDGPEVGTIWTNNVLVASFMKDVDDTEDPFLVAEQPSRCTMLGGRYYPSYGMTLLDVASPEEYCIPELDNEHIDMVLLGTTSLVPETGPRGRSAPNRGFKRALMVKALDDISSRIVVCLELDKLGMLLGEPCDDRIWTQLLASDRCTVLVGGQLGLDEVTVDARRRITESLQSYVRSKSGGGQMEARILLVDADGKGIEPEKYLTNLGNR